jgi:glycosyltransferase involved in cell wall biosynthesis
MPVSGYPVRYVAPGGTHLSRPWRARRFVSGTNRRRREPSAARGSQAICGPVNASWLRAVSCAPSGSAGGMTDASTDQQPVRVSVLITAYNHEGYIERAIEGALQQRGVPLEILVGDDRSEDGTRAVIEGVARRYPDLVHPHFPEQNRGGGGKVLFADLIAMARGDYIAGLDGDDYWTSPDKLLRQVAHLDAHPESAMVFHNVVREYEDDDRPSDLYLPVGSPARLDWQDFLGTNPVPSCSPLFRREVLDPLPAWYFPLPWGDWPLYFIAAERGNIDYLPEVMGVFRFHSKGMYSGLTPVLRRRNEVDFFRQISEIAPPHMVMPVRRRLALALSRLASALVQSGQIGAARRAATESFRVWPPDPRKLHRGLGERARVVTLLKAWRPVRTDGCD